MKIPFGFIDGVLDRIVRTPQHRYQILTKRPMIMQRYFATRDVPRNAWLGVSVENKKHGLPRIDVLRSIPAEVRFLSIEPLLEDLGEFDLSGMSWIIVGGESGPRRARCGPIGCDRSNANAKCWASRSFSSSGAVTGTMESGERKRATGVCSMDAHGTNSRHKGAESDTHDEEEAL